MPTLLERMYGLFSRSDAAPLALPGPVAPEPVASSASVWEYQPHSDSWLAVESRQDSVSNPLTGLGGSYDKGQIARPNAYIIPLAPQELRSLFANNGIANRIVSLPAKRACRRGWTVPEIGDEDRRLQTYPRVEEAMTWARLHGGSPLLMVTEDDVPSSFRGRPIDWLREPLDLRRVGKLHALQPFDAVEAAPVRWNTDVRSPGYRMPAEWRISADGFSATVHASRVVYFRGAKRPPSEARGGFAGNRLPDDSCLQAVWDEIRRLTETLQGGAVMAQELRESVLTIANLSAKRSSDQASVIDEQISLIARGKALLGMILLGKDDKYENRSNPPTGFKELSSGAWEALAAATGIPQVILMGSTPGGLNTDGASSWEGFRALVSDYQEANRAELERLYEVVYAAQDGPTGGKAPKGWTLTFETLDEPDLATQAEIRKNTALADSAYLAREVISRQDVADARFGPGGWSMDLIASGPVPPARVVQPGIAARGPAAVPGVGAPAPREDASAGSACILVPCADQPELRRTVEAAIGQTLRVDDQPHITVLYLGEVAQLDEVVQVVQDEVEDSGLSDPLTGGVVRAFPIGADGVPVVVEFSGAWALSELNGHLLRRLAHLVSARQFPRYRAHLTLGYAAKPLDTEAATALLAVDADVRVPVQRVDVCVGRTVVASVEVSG